MESQLFIYQESTSLVKPALTPLAVKKAPMKAFPVSNARSITSSGSTSKVGSSKAAVATATTQIEKKGPEGRLFLWYMLNTCKSIRLGRLRASNKASKDSSTASE